MNNLQPGCSCCQPNLFAWYDQPLRYVYSQYDHAAMPRWVRDIHEDAGYLPAQFGGSETLPKLRWGDAYDSDAGGRDVFYMVFTPGVAPANRPVFSLRRYNTLSRAVVEIVEVLGANGDRDLPYDIFTFRVDADRETAHCIFTHTTPTIQGTLPVYQKNYGAMTPNGFDVPTSLISSDTPVVPYSNVTRTGRTVGSGSSGFNSNMLYHFTRGQRGAALAIMQGTRTANNVTLPVNYQNYGPLLEFGSGETYMTASCAFRTAFGGQAFVLQQHTVGGSGIASRLGFFGLHNGYLDESPFTDAAILDESGAVIVAGEGSPWGSATVTPITGVGVAWKATDVAPNVQRDLASHWSPGQESVTAYGVTSLSEGLPQFATAVGAGFPLTSTTFESSINHGFAIAGGI